jgi:hypothetical protein
MRLRSRNRKERGGLNPLAPSIFRHIVEKISKPFWIEEDDINQENLRQRQIESDEELGYNSRADQQPIKDIHLCLLYLSLYGIPYHFRNKETMAANHD